MPNGYEVTFDLRKGDKMAVTSGQSIIRFHNVYDLTPDYKHTRYFKTSALRDAYFDTHTESNYTVNSQYVRVDSGEVKVPFHIKNVHQFTYMSITNSLGTTGTLDHRYYCFVIDMDYVADNCTLVKFKVDVMQTYGIGTVLTSSMPNSCLVARCHSQTDAIGDNLVTEPFNVGDYVEGVPNIARADMLTYKIVVGLCSNREVHLNGVTINLRPRNYTNRIYTGTTYLVFDISDAHGNQGLTDLINQMNDYPDEIVSIYAVPSCLIGSVTDSYVLNPTAPVASLSSVYQGGRQTSAGFEGYSPKNKKLYTAPFTMLRVTNYEGEKIDLAFELFSNPDYCEFEFDGTLIGEPSCSVYPRNYALGVSTQYTQTNYDYSVSADNYACGSWASDVFGSYMQKNGMINAIKMLMGTLGTMALSSFATGGVGAVASVGTGLVTASSGANMQMQDRALRQGEFAPAKMNFSPSSGEMIDISRGTSVGLGIAWKSACEMIRAKNTGNTSYGTGTKGTTAQINAHKGIYFKTIKIRKYLAEQIDNFFTMYGYAQNKLMNVGQYLSSNTRPRYAYVQCEDFVVTNSDCENKYKVELAKIMNNGITFWWNGAIGNYSGNDLT